MKRSLETTAGYMNKVFSQEGNLKPMHRSIPLLFPIMVEVDATDDVALTTAKMPAPADNVRVFVRCLGTLV